MTCQYLCFYVLVVLYWVSLCTFGLGGDSDVNGHSAPVQYGVGDDVPGAQSGVSVGFLP